MQLTFHLNNLRISPRKVRVVAETIKGKKAVIAQNLLQFQNRKPGKPLLKLLNSGINAAEKNFNLGIEGIKVSNVRVDGGPTIKRYLPRAYGRTGPILKRTSHVTLVLESMVEGRVKKVIKKIPEIKAEIGEEFKGEVAQTQAEKATTKELRQPPKEIKPKLKGLNLGRKIFRRKAIG